MRRFSFMASYGLMIGSLIRTVLACLLWILLVSPLSAQSRHGSHVRTSHSAQSKPIADSADNTDNTDTQEEASGNDPSGKAVPPTVGSPLPRPADTSGPNGGDGWTSPYSIPPNHKPLPIPLIHASSAILMDAVSGQILYARNADQMRPMASTTKIMTALLFCEHVPNENTLVTASKYASTIRESSLHLKPNEKLTAHDLLRAILMRSANDGCVAAAEYVAGSVSAFADLMNKRAVQLGCTHTHFANPNGLNDRRHYTTAHDLALIARQAMQIARISEVTRLRYCRIKRSKNNLDVTMRNHSQKFLKSYPGADGIKTGWTIPAGHCFVGSATRRGWRLIAVVLNSPDFVHETSALMDYGFTDFAPHLLARVQVPIGTCQVEGGVTPTIPIAALQPLQIVVPNDQPVTPDSLHTRITLRPQTAPVRFGKTVGVLEALQNDTVVCSTPLVTMRGDSSAPRRFLLPQNSVSFKSLLWLTSIFVIGVVSLLYYGKGIAASTKNARRRWRRLTKSL